MCLALVGLSPKMPSIVVRGLVTILFGTCMIILWSRTMHKGKCDMCEQEDDELIPAGRFGFVCTDCAVIVEDAEAEAERDRGLNR